MNDLAQIENINSVAARALVSFECKCSKVYFDLFKIKKPEAVYKTYRIKGGESIIAFSKSTLSLISITVDGIVFTNKALYLHPNTAKDMPSNRFAYVDLCNYLITQENDRGSIHLQNKNADYRIYDSTLVFKNTAGKEIQLILETIQEKLLEASQLAQEQYNEQVQWVLSLGRNEIDHGLLSARTKALLDVLARNTSYKKDAIFLIAESLFRLCNRKKYQIYLDSVESALSFTDIYELQQPPTRFMETLLSQLADLDHSFSNDYLNKTCLNVSGDDFKATSELFDVAPMDEPYLHVLAYCQIRTNSIPLAQDTIARIRKKFGDSHANPIEYFSAFYQNRQMLNAYNALCSGKEIDKAWYSMSDCYGLTLLHYALILKNDTAADQILTIQKSHKLPPSPDDIDISWMYDYTLLACGTQSKLKEQVFLLFDPDMIRLEKEIATQKLKVAHYDLKLSGISSMQSQCKSRITYLEQNDPYSSDLENLYSKKNELIEEYRTCVQSKLDAEKELDNKEKQRGLTYNNAIKYALNNLDKLRNSEEPLAKFLFRLYFEPSFLYSVLSSTQTKCDTKLYKYADLYFIAPEFAGIDPTIAVNMEGYHTDEGSKNKPNLVYCNSTHITENGDVEIGVSILLNNNDKQDFTQIKVYLEHSQKSFYVKIPNWISAGQSIRIRGEGSTTISGTKGNLLIRINHVGYAPITPPHGTSWFSVDAHTDAAALKAEYRALVKKYHPDVCQHPDSNAAMQQIAAEYEDLLRKI